jgi:hypothetical protein
MILETIITTCTDTIIVSGFIISLVSQMYCKYTYNNILRDNADKVEPVCNTKVNSWVKLGLCTGLCVVICGALLRIYDVISDLILHPDSIISDTCNQIIVSGVIIAVISGLTADSVCKMDWKSKNSDIKIECNNNRTLITKARRGVCAGVCIIICGAILHVVATTNIQIIIILCMNILLYQNEEL